MHERIWKASVTVTIGLANKSSATKREGGERLTGYERATESGEHASSDSRNELSIQTYYNLVLTSMSGKAERLVYA